MNEHLDDILYPPLEPYETGELIVGDGHRGLRVARLHDTNRAKRLRDL